MGPELFIDASAWYPLALSRHPDHRRLSEALTTRIRDGARIVTTNLVLAEAHAILTSRAGAAVALTFLRTARARPNAVVISTDELEERAQSRWLERFRDQPFSLADAVSFAVMDDRNIGEALTLDHHFAVAGFVMVPAAR